MSNYLAKPKLTPRGGVLVFHAWWGLNASFKGLCDRLADEGFLALAPDLYQGKIATTIPEAKKLRTKMKRDIVSSEILQAVEHLCAQAAIQGQPIGVIGFSLGAYWALWLAEQKPEVIAATVLFYGSRGGKYTGKSSAFLGHFAEADQYVAESGRKKLEKSLKAAGHEVAFHVYPGSGHWFFENDRPAFNPEAAALAWDRTLAFLNAHL